MNARLEELNKTKTKFLSLISHDIRGNIGSINSFLQLITSEFESFHTEELKNSLISLHQVSATSCNTLENLLKWSKNELIELKPEYNQISLKQTIEEILEFFRHMMDLKEIRLEKELGTSLFQIETNENMISAILRNLISNAIKFSRKGGTIYVALTENDGKTQVLIRDTGIGMSEETVRKLFTYDNKNQQKNKSFPGEGIGLLLTNEFIEKLGIDVSVKSEPDKGTTVLLTF